MPAASAAAPPRRVVRPSARRAPPAAAGARADGGSVAAWRTAAFVEQQRRSELPLLGVGGTRSEACPLQSSIGDTAAAAASDVSWNLEWPELYAAALAHPQVIGSPELTASGVLLARTGARTGRSPDDKFVVCDGNPAVDVWWGANNPMERETFEALKDKVCAHLGHHAAELHVQDLRAGGAAGTEGVPVRVVSESPWHASFARNVLQRPSSAEALQAHVPRLTVLHAPTLEMDGAADGINSEALVALDLEGGVVLIAGTEYAGEIKKAVFTAMNYWLPAEGVMPLHASCSAPRDGEEGGAAVFFGLSGTGKTTLSADPLRELVGDDEHAWSDEGVTNIEGGCYAKLIDLREEAEPLVYATTHMPGSILENVVLDETGEPDFEDTSLTENTRGSYPIEYIPNRAPGLATETPATVVFLSCDAFGVLPPLARLTPEQASYHFMSGYTSKVAGTEVGIKEPQATFSACFGAPFMPRHPAEYADLLASKLRSSGAEVWMLNTGWVAGGYGKSERFSIQHTRALLNAALEGKLDGVTFVTDQRFGFEVPTEVPGVPSELLAPRGTWEDGAAYDAAADRLASLFVSNFTKFEGRVSDAVLASAPHELHKEMFVTSAVDKEMAEGVINLVDNNGDAASPMSPSSASSESDWYH
eukprot:PRCOL_00006889-RA